MSGDSLEPLPPWADGLAQGYTDLGALLPTRDGRRVGNATLIERVPTNFNGDVYSCRIVTDRGNFLLLTPNELEELFWPPTYTKRIG